MSYKDGASFDVNTAPQGFPQTSFPRRPCINFAQGFCKHGDQCRYLHDPNVQPDAKAVELYQRGELGVGSNGGQVANAGFRPCNAFAAGNCTFGDRCRYSHNGEPPALNQQGSGPFIPQRKPCFSFQKGQCTLGDSCTYSHDAADNSGQNSIQFNKKPCFTFQNTGFCSRGESCNFSHSIGGSSVSGTGAFAQAFTSPASADMSIMGTGKQDIHGFTAGLGQGSVSGMAGLPSVASHPVIFSGHFGRAIRSPLGMDTTEPVEPLSENDERGVCVRVYEARLGPKTFFLEGIHVVPRGMQPPSYSCTDGTIIHTESGLLTGQTTPEGTPFELEVFARNVDTSTLQSVCRTSITGGVQWLPFVSPHNTIAIDHLLFRGSFDNLTILIHGGEIDGSLLTNQALETVNAGPPLPNGWTGQEGNDDNQFDYSSDEDGDKDTIRQNKSQGDRFACQSPPSSKVLHAAMCCPHALHLIASEPLRSKGDVPNGGASSTSSLLLSSFTALVSPYTPAGAIVSVECVAALVEHIFEGSYEGAEEPIVGESSALIRLEQRMQKLLVLLENVWSSAITPQIFEHMIAHAHPGVGAYESLAVVLDEDATQTACNSVLSALQVMILDSPGRLEFARPDSTSVVEDGGEIAGNESEIFMLLGNAALACVASLMKNDSMFRAWSHTGGIKALVLLARQSPSLPPAAHDQCLHLIAKAVRRFHTAALLLSPPAMFETSGYQDLLELARNSAAIDASVATPLRDALNWLYLSHTCCELQRAGRDPEGGLESLASMASALTTYIAAVNATETSNTMVVDTNTHNALLETQVASKKSLNNACSQLLVIYETVAGRAAALRAAIAVCSNANIVRTNDDCMNVEVVSLAIIEKETQSAIALLLTEADVSASLVLLAALTQTADEYINAMTWDAPHSEELVAVARGSRAALASTTAAILICCGAASAAIFAAKPLAVQLIWQFTAAEEHVLMMESPNELVSLAKTSLATNGAGTIARISSSPALFRPASVGWILKLLVLTAQAVKKVLQSKWKRSTVMLQQGNTPSSLRSTESTCSDILHALQTLLEICSFPAGAEIATRVIAPLLLRTILDISQDIACGRGVQDIFAVDLPVVTPIDLQVLELCLQLVHHCTRSKDADTVAELVRPYKSAKGTVSKETLLSDAFTSISAISASISSASIVNTESSVWCCKILEAISINGKAVVDIDTGLDVVLKAVDTASMLIKESNLGALALSMQMVSHHGKYALASHNINSIEADPLSTSLQAATNVLIFTMSLVSKGVTWAVEPAASTAGFNYCDFGNVTRDPPVEPNLSSCQIPKAERDTENDSGTALKPMSSESMISYLVRAEVVHHSLLSALQLIDACLTAAHTGGATSGPASVLLVDTLCEANAYAFSILGLDRTGSPGFIARHIALLTAQILLHYCPPLNWSIANPGLIPYLLDRGSKVPHLLESNMELLTALMSMSIVQGSNRARSISTSTSIISSVTGWQPGICVAPEMAAHWQLLSFQGEDVEGIATTSDAASLNGVIQGKVQRENMSGVLVLGSGRSDGRGRASLHRWSHDNAEHCCYAWSNLLDAIPLRIGRKIVPFCIAYAPLSAQSAAIKTGDQDNSNMQKTRIYTHMEFDSKPSYMVAKDTEDGKNTSDPWYYLRQYSLNCSHTPMTLILHAVTSCSIPSHNAAYRLCRGVMALSPQAAHQLVVPLLGTLQNISLFLLAYSSRALTRVTDHSASVMEALREPQVLVHSSNDACRYLLLLESLCADDCCCLMLCASGLIYVALSCLHCLRQEVVVLALQVLTTTYRSLMRLTAHLEIRLALLQTAANGATSSNSMNGSASLEEAVDQNSELALSRQLLSHINSLSKALADALVEILPSVASRFQAPIAPVTSGIGADAPLALLQIAFLLPLLSYQHSKALLDNLALGMTVEVFCIKLWLNAEESMQGLVEASEVVKALLTDTASSMPDDVSPGILPASANAASVLGKDAGQSYVRCALAQAATSLSALRHALELAILAYSRGWISLIVLQRAMRSTLVDPKHLITAYQRVYMILANDRASVEEARTLWILRKTSDAKAANAISTKSCGIGSNNQTKKKSKRTDHHSDDDDEAAENLKDAGLLHLSKLPGLQLRSVNESDCVRSDALVDDEVRHAMIATSLAQIKDSVVSARQHFSLQVDRQVLADRFAGSATSGSEIDMQAPFGKLDFVSSSGTFETANTVRVLQAFYSSSGHSAEYRLNRHAFCTTEDAYHRALRKPIVEGDDRRASIFNAAKPGIVNSDAYASNFIRLRALPRKVDPAGVDRRKSRRMVRQNEIDTQNALQAREKRKLVEAKAAEEREKRARLNAQEAELSNGGSSLDPSLAHIPKALLARRFGASAGPAMTPSVQAPIPPNQGVSTSLAVASSVQTGVPSAPPPIPVFFPPNAVSGVLPLPPPPRK